MKKFIHLLSFEMNRFLKFLVPTLLIAAGVQLFVTISESIAYNNVLQELVATGESIESHPPFSIHNITGDGLYELSVILIILIFMVYSFFTWYREWLGKNTFIYRLLMLPVNRSYILWTKAAVFLIGGLLAFVFQFGMYFLQIQIAEWIVTSSHYTAVHVHNAQPMFGLVQAALFPTSVFEFISTYSFAFGALFSLFAGILIERSFGLKGAIIGVIYFIGYFIFYGFIQWMLFSTNFSFTLLPSQMALTMLGYQLLMIVVGILISQLLLKNKVKI